jgi:hypothetical protein
MVKDWGSVIYLIEEWNGTVLSSFVLGKTAQVRGANVVVVRGPCIIGSSRAKSLPRGDRVCRRDL